MKTTPDTSEVIRKGLTFVGYDVLIAEHGRQAVVFAAHLLPDVIIMAMRLPKMNGIEATIRQALASASGRLGKSSSATRRPHRRVILPLTRGHATYRNCCMDLLVATTNAGKLAEIEAVLKNFFSRILSPNDLANCPIVEEDGDTFEANALKKARALGAFTGRVTLADDSGLQVDALGGAPGVYSARYAGENAADAANNEKLLRVLAGAPEEKRGARFVCVLALFAPAAFGGSEWLFRAECEGRIALAPRGDHGFGYDPLFFYPPLNRTFGELDREAKSRVSHRGLALRKLAEALPSLSIVSKTLRG